MVTSYEITNEMFEMFVIQKCHLSTKISKVEYSPVHKNDTGEYSTNSEFKLIVHGKLANKNGLLNGKLIGNMKPYVVNDWIWENGVATAPIKMTKLIADIYRVSIMDIIGEEITVKKFDLRENKLIAEIEIIKDVYSSTIPNVEKSPKASSEIGMRPSVKGNYSSIPNEGEMVGNEYIILKKVEYNDCIGLIIGSLYSGFIKVTLNVYTDNPECTDSVKRCKGGILISYKENIKIYEYDVGMMSMGTEIISCCMKNDILISAKEYNRIIETYKKSKIVSMDGAMEMLEMLYTKIKVLHWDLLQI